MCHDNLSGEIRFVRVAQLQCRQGLDGGLMLDLAVFITRLWVGVETVERGHQHEADGGGC
jgi:hypothetical protein